ncbi:MAG: DUF998 domain-containing protein [Paracoccaceae bacterium]
METPIARLGIIWIALAILIGPYFSLSEYNWIKHTTSELGGQSMPFAWIMNSGFIAYGVATATAAIIMFRAQPVTSVALLIFGTGLIGAGLFSALPIDSSLASDIAEDRLHSIFSSLTGFGIIAATASRIFWPAHDIRDRLSWATLIASIALPAAMFALPDDAGGLQRLMFMTSFIWV